jgi:hypothetical protein
MSDPMRIGWLRDETWQEAPAMRLLRVRFTIRRMMIAVALAAAALGLFRCRSWLRDMEAYHWDQWSIHAGRLKPEEEKLADHHDRMARAYGWLAGHLYPPIEPRTPEQK